MEMGSSSLSAALCAAAWVGWDEAEAVPAPEKRHHKKTSQEEQRKEESSEPPAPP